ncbi:MAG TPA: amidohydrolase family protein [Vicinamibacterales bacterium]|nr:amidohydrolase family protein [Vicinamibacterales bacterium]
MRAKFFLLVSFVIPVLAGALVLAQQGQGTAGQQQPPPAQGRGGGGARGGGVQLQRDGECPAGMTMWRYLQCRAPEWPVPSIVDYRPKTTLVTEEHLVPKAKFPAVDVHGHAGGNIATPEALAAFVAKLDAVGVGVYVSADNTSGARLTQTLDVIRNSPYKDRIRVFTGIPLQGVGPGWAERAVAQLEADVKAGAVGVGEVGKGFGLTARKADGSRLAVDEPMLDAFWAACGRLGIPAFIHTAEPQEFFNQPDMHNERWLELALFSDRRNYTPDKPTFEQLMTERNNVFRRNPKTKFIAAHFGWHANNLGRAAKMLDEFPNVYVELGAVLYDLGRQPRAAHDFFVKYQDRILFGKDSFEPEEFPYYWRVLETKDEYFDYYRDYHAFWKMYGMDLPDPVLRKVYYENALKIVPGMPKIAR